MKKNKMLGTLIIFLFTFIIFTSGVNANSYTWEYSEDLAGYEVFPIGITAGYQGFNSFALDTSVTVDYIAIYSFAQAWNATHTPYSRMGIYSDNGSNSPDILLAKTAQFPILSLGWQNNALDVKISLVAGVTYWFSWIHAVNNTDWRYGLRSETQPSIWFSHFVNNSVWDLLVNPVTTEILILPLWRLACFRIGEEIITTEIETNFWDIFANPEGYIAGLVVCSLIVMTLYFIIRRR